MQEKQTALFFLETFVIVTVLGLLSAVAIPDAGRMINNSRAMSREAEFHDIQTAVTEMLYDSTGGMLVSVGPTSDMSLVRTRDTPPLILKNYLSGRGSSPDKLDYTYGFTADGVVIQITP
jgi:Tfp pilus assembly protein PilE